MSFSRVAWVVVEEASIGITHAAWRLPTSASLHWQAAAVNLNQKGRIASRFEVRGRLEELSCIARVWDFRVLLY
jgi:hypothetical protein